MFCHVIVFILKRLYLQFIVTKKDNQSTDLCYVDMFIILAIFVVLLKIYYYF